MTPRHLAELAGRKALQVLGFCHAVREDGVGDGTIVLLGPREPGFWAYVQQATEFSDGEDDPLDRWSNRVISEMAEEIEATPLFPFGTPARPFISWALRSGRAWASPVGLLVHEEAGLLVSYRGALLLPDMLSIDAGKDRPCDTCQKKPCLDACPASALSRTGYDLNSCHGFLDTHDGASCLEAGCIVRRACPVSQSYPRDPRQSAFHMAAFHPRATTGTKL